MTARCLQGSRMMAQLGVEHLARVFVGGVLGAAAMMAASKAAGSPVMGDLQRLAGTVVFEPNTAGSRLLGSGAQLLNGGLLAQGYLEAINRMRIDPGWRSGLAIGIMHGAIAGVALGLVPAVHPRVPEQVRAPGWFLRRRGASGAVTLIALHALFGSIVGHFCRPGDPLRAVCSRHPRP